MPGVTVYLNRDGLNTVEADERSVQVTRELPILLENHGKPTHVHLHLDDELASLGSIEESHLFIPEGEWREAALEVTESATGRGRLDVSAGYGQEQTGIDVTVDAPDGATPEPSETASERTETESTADGSAVPSVDLPIDLDEDRLRNPPVIGATVLFLVVFFGLLVIDPLGAFGAVFGVIVAGIAAWGYFQSVDAEAEAPET